MSRVLTTVDGVSARLARKIRRFRGTPTPPSPYAAPITSGAPASTSAAGNRTEPSARWPFSISAISVRLIATAVPFRVCRTSGDASGPGRKRAPSLRAW